MSVIELLPYNSHLISRVLSWAIFREYLNKGNNKEQFDNYSSKGEVLNNLAAEDSLDRESGAVEGWWRKSIKKVLTLKLKLKKYLRAAA